MSDWTGQNSLKFVRCLLKSGHDRKENQKWNNAMYQDDFCGRICELLSRRFLQKYQIYKYITHSPDNSIISVKLHFVQFWFLLRPSYGPICKEGGGGRKPKLREGRGTEETKVQKKDWKSDIISVKNVLILTADLSPNWWVGTSDSTGQNSLKFVYCLLRIGHDRKKNQKWNIAMYQDDFCGRNCELLSRRFLQKSQIYKYITAEIIALFRSRPPFASAGLSWGGRGHLYEKFVLLNSILRTCNLKLEISGFSLDKLFKRQSPSKLQVRKVRLKRTKFRKRYPHLPQEWQLLAQGGRDWSNAIIRG